MSNFTSPARARFPRSNVTGSKPAMLAPGSLAVNWADKVIWVGSAAGTAVSFSRKIEDWADLEYRVGDIVIQEGNLYRCKVDQAQGAGFIPTAWQPLSDVGRSNAAQPYASDIYEGGEVSTSAPSNIQIAAGVGAIIDNTDPASVSITDLAWGATSATLAYPGETWSVIALDASASVVQLPASSYAPDFRRQHIELAVVLWGADETVSQVYDTSVRAGGMSESFVDAYAAQGGAYRVQGVRNSAVLGTLNIQFSAGEVFALGWQWRTATQNPNIVTVTSLSPAPFTRVLAAGAVTGPAETAIDVDGMDTGATTPQTVPSGRWTIQYVYAVPDLSAVFVQYGQADYADLTVARNAIADDFESLATFVTAAPLMLIGAIIVQQGQSDLDHALFIEASRGRSPFTVTPTADDAAYFYLDGSRPMTGDADLGGNRITNVIIDGGDFV